MTDRRTDVSVDVLPLLAGTVLVRVVSCPGSHPTVDRLVVACGPPDWVGALKRVQGESCPGLHPTVDPLAGWPKASDEHVLKQTSLTPSFARGSRLQTTPKRKKGKGYLQRAARSARTHKLCCKKNGTQGSAIAIMSSSTYRRRPGGNCRRTRRL